MKLKGKLTLWLSVICYLLEAKKTVAASKELQKTIGKKLLDFEKEANL